METRKVQLTGGSTYIVSLPKKWVKEVGISANDTLGIIPQQDGTLILTPTLVKGRDEKKKRIIVKDEETEHILRALIGSYMMGYEIIEVKTQTDMPTEIRQTVRKFTQMTIGPEIVEEAARSVTTRDLLDPTDLPFETSIRRIYYISKGMITDALRALKDEDAVLAVDVISRDTDVDRLNWLVARQFNMMIYDAQFATKVGTTRERGVCFLQISRLLERIADHASKIAASVERLEDQKTSPGNKKSIFDVGTQAGESVDLAMGAFFKGDLVAVNNLIDATERTISKCDKIDEKLASEDGGSAVIMGNILESIRRISLYSRDVCECAINYLVDAEPDAR